MIPVLWLAGPPGVGKTAVGWEIYRRFGEAGADAAFADIDQLGICYPATPNDPDRHALKARNLAALRANFAAAGARCLVVSGVVGAAEGPRLAPPLTALRLTADPETLRARLAARGGVPSALREAAVAEAAGLDRAAWAAAVIDTAGLTLAEAAAAALAAARWPPPAPRLPPPGPTLDPPPTADILWLSGPPGVGKSTVGFQAWLRTLAAGPAAYVDIRQVGFCAAALHAPALQSANLAALWRNFHAAGARRCIVTGAVLTSAEVAAYEHALPAARFTWIRLHAAEGEQVRRLLTRRTGGSWAEPADPLRDRSASDLATLASLPFPADAPGEPVDVTTLDPASAAEAVLGAAGWR